MRSLLVLTALFVILGVAAWLLASPPDDRQAGAGSTSPDPAATELPEITVPPDLADEPPPSGAAREFQTDFSQHTVPYGEILSGGPPKDGIPAIDDPRFVSMTEADAWLEAKEPVVFLQVGEDARAYPIQILVWHEIVNDVVGDQPLVVTFCPLCNTAIAFERTFDGQVLDFGTTGRLRFSNLIMYDRQTESWWQQATGEGIAGRYAGRLLKFLPAAIISWEDFKAAHPDGRVLSRETGFRRSYGDNPYAGYDDINNTPFLYRGPAAGDALLPMARVLTVELEGEAVAYPYDLLQEAHVANDTIAGAPVVIFWEAGTNSAFRVSRSSDDYRDVGTASAFSRRVNGQVLTFRFEAGVIRDDETRSTWNVLGEAVAGDLAGTRLEPVVSVNHFWFSWAAFRPETRIYSVP